MRLIFLFVTIFILSSCSKPETNDAHPIVAAYTDAYNDKNLEVMSSLMHPDIEWLSVNDSTISVEAKGKTVLSDAMKGYFADPNMPTGSLRDWSVNGDYIAVTETAHWVNKTGESKSQSALTVYQLEDDLVRRVYYYAAE